MNLHLRLWLTNLLVLVVGLVGAATIGHGYKSKQFPKQVSRLESRYQSKESSEGKAPNPDIQTFSLDAIALFDRINDRGTAFALGATLIGVSGLSLGLTHSILRPLRQIDQAAKRFNSGDMAARVPPSNIPEIHQLGLTLNSVANHLQGLEERRQQLVGDLAHELGTPLTIIQAYVEMLESGVIPISSDIWKELLEETARMSRLLEDLVTLSKIESGGMPLRLQAVSPYPLIRRVVRIFKARKWQNNCTLELDCPAELPQVFADPDRFRRILNNLISNALTYTPEGTVTVQVQVIDDDLWIAVKDTGIGISKADLPHVFERFWRSKDSRHLRHDGSGIGLAITKRLVEVMGGMIEVSSELGEGSTFRFSLPLAGSKSERAKGVG
ncbi:sensor histidine kinase [Leptolyngbyaceae cyanobacterium UHCC 1019]